MFKRPKAKHAKSSVFDSRLLISVENDGLFDVHVALNLKLEMKIHHYHVQNTVITFYSTYKIP